MSAPLGEELVDAEESRTARGREARMQGTGQVTTVLHARFQRTPSLVSSTIIPRSASSRPKKQIPRCARNDTFALVKPVIPNEVRDLLSVRPVSTARRPWC